MRKLNSCKGASAVEFALVLPLLAVILFGIVEFGLLLYNKQVITNASREGARFGIVSSTPRKQFGNATTPDTIIYRVRQYCANNLTSFSGNSETVFSGTACSGFGNDLTVTVNYNHNFLVFPNVLNLIHGSISGSIPLTATTVMKCE
jgi:Flp pilus assembly protein TadG